MREESQPELRRAALVLRLVLEQSLVVVGSNPRLAQSGVEDGQHGRNAIQHQHEPFHRLTSFQIDPKQIHDGAPVKRDEVAYVGLGQILFAATWTGHSSKQRTVAIVRERFFR